MVIERMRTGTAEERRNYRKKGRGDQKKKEKRKIVARKCQEFVLTLVMQSRMVV